MIVLKTAGQKTAVAALCAALVTCATFLSVPVPGFRLYFNFGEGVIYCTAILFGKTVGGLCGGLGAALADLLLGYPLWAPFTFVIKGIEGYVVGRLAPYGEKKAMAVGAVIMAAGYSTMAAVLYGIPAAPVELVTDIAQTSVGALFACFMVPQLRKIVTTEK
ncbi:MAG: ECF transporter S component [Pyramidobacter sp.]|nr:ECF transporter S component [Pyramidobacter sp.]